MHEQPPVDKVTSADVHSKTLSSGYSCSLWEFANFCTVLIDGVCVWQVSEDITEKVKQTKNMIMKKKETSKTKAN